MKRSSLKRTGFKRPLPIARGYAARNPGRCPVWTSRDGVNAVPCGQDMVRGRCPEHGKPQKPLQSRTPMGGFRTNRNKFGAVASNDGHQSYDSLGERRRWSELELLQRGGEITDLVFKPKVVLIPATAETPEIAWHTDYSYTEKGRTVHEDWKPRPPTPRENLLFKLWRHFGPGLLRISGSRRFAKDIMGMGRRVV